MTLALNAARLFAAGFTDLVSVIPPTATLAPTSRISAEQRGKVPGRKTQYGTWTGYDWRKWETSAETAAGMDRDGANVGIRCDRFPAVDVDCSDAALSALILAVARDTLGPAPARVGRAPKSLLLYRTDTPFGRLRLWIKDVVSQDTHLIEVLGAGQQFVAAGIHPATRKPYAWERDIAAEGAAVLTAITLEQAQAFLNDVSDALLLAGYECWREGTGGAAARDGVEQTELLAPSLDALAEAVAMIPNDDPATIGRDAYIKLGCAIKAAAGVEEADAFGIFAEWALRWPGNERAANTTFEIVRDDWRRIKPPFSVGWHFIVELARPQGYNDAANEFEPIPLDADIPAVPPRADGPQPVRYSDHDLAARALKQYRDRIRAVPMWDAFLVWDGYRWRRDEMNQTGALISEVLLGQADMAAREGATPAEQRHAVSTARGILNANSVQRVKRLLSQAPDLVLHPSQLDTSPWLLNTPGGCVDLRTGNLLAHDVDRLLSKSTSVTPDASACPRWLRFLEESCDGPETVGFLRRFAGYCLTGSIREHSLCFVWGPGGNGKSVFLDTLAYVLGDYATHAPMETFTASKFDRHPTEVAALQGARMVTANETDAGRSWNEQRLKALTGGGEVSARMMRTDFFKFRPQFKLLIVGNHMPVIRTADDAMRRRLHLVPFVKRPAEPDKDLPERLREEAPGILAWAVQGCLEWQRDGLAPPDSIVSATDDYFDEEDSMGRWLTENCLVGADQNCLTMEAYGSWRDWCGRFGEHSGTAKAFAAQLHQRGFPRWLHPVSRRRGFAGLRPKDQALFPVPTEEAAS